MKQFSHILILILAGFVGFSCSDEQLTSHSPSSWQGNEQIQLTLTAAKEIRSGETRAVDATVNEGTESGYQISDFVLFQFDEHGKRIVDPQYYTYAGGAQTIPVVIPTGEQKYDIVVLANTHDPLAPYYFADATTLDALMGKYKLVQKLTDTYQQQENGSSDLLMNGWTTIDKNTQALNLTLYRNVAKLTLTINNTSGSGITIKTAQVKSVPTKIDYFYQLIADQKSGSLAAPYPNPNTFRNFDYEVDQFNVADGSSHTLTYYLPCHLMGTSTSSSETTKGNYAPDYATFVELYAEKNDGSKFARYRFYLGDNKTDNYNIRPNYHYDLPLTFNGLGNPQNDARVEFMNAIRTEPEANSYILNPLSTTEQQMYQIPVVHRINTFWQNEYSAGHIPSATAYTINTENEWVAEVLWQTSDQQLIQFCNTDGTLTGNEGRMPAIYTGQVPLKVKPCQGASGNVIVGVYRNDIPSNNDPKTREYSWSWHLWVTDYNPDECRNQNWDGRYKYTLSNGSGEVHRYKGNNWDLESDKYHNKWMMDRNLGALTSVGNTKQSAGMYYQFGRKDPFDKLANGHYNYDATTNSFKKISLLTNVNYNSNITLDYLVKHPYYYNKGNGPYNNAYVTKLWDNPDWYKNSKGQPKKKSFFDPCPSGWRIAESDAWSGVIQNYSYSTGFGYTLYLDGIINGNNQAWFPWCCDMWQELNSLQHNFLIMTTTPFSNTNFNCFWSGNGTKTHIINFGRNVGGNVRAIQYDEEADE